MDNGNQTFEMFCDIASAFAPCMNDYLYVYNMKADMYYISEEAVGRFLLPSALFHNVESVLQNLIHPEDFEMLIEDIHLIQTGKKDYHNLEYRWLGKDGSPIWINCKGRVLKDDDGNPFLMLGCINEIGNTQKADNISGLLGESALHDQVVRMFPSISDAMFLRIGIDDFKVLNERHGIEYGNYVLREIAQCIQQCMGPMQHAYRVISDEFMVLDMSGVGFDEMKELYDRIRVCVDQVVEKEQYKALYTISAGLVNLKDVDASATGYNSYNEAMKLSEFALNQAKLRGKNQMYYFRPDDYSSFLRKRYIRSCLRKSLGNNFSGFELYFQPIVKAGDGTLYAAETLLRFKTPMGEQISPVEFIPILEESGMIIPVGKWIISNSLLMCRTCREFCPDFMISINFSYIQLLKSNVYDDIIKSLADTMMPPSCMIVELTESGHLENSPAVQSVWQKLRSAGVNIALDDFGTGYSNLINIGNLRPNIVKIDRSFTVKALNNTYEHELLVHIIHMVHSIGLNLIVEGIENGEELAKVTALNPDYIQGYYYSKPCSKEDFILKFRPGD